MKRKRPLNRSLLNRRAKEHFITFNVPCSADESRRQWAHAMRLAHRDIAISREVANV